MKKINFVLRFLIFVAIFLLINHWVTRAYVRFTRQPYVYEHNRKGFQAVQDETSFLVLGDSHPLHAVNSSMIPGGYNFASSGESYILTYYKLLRHMESSSLDLDVVILPISLHTFSGYRRSEVGSQDPAFWAQYMNYLEVGRKQNQLGHFLKVRIEAEFAYLGGLEEVFEVIYPTEPWEVDDMTHGFLHSEERLSDRTPEEISMTAVSRAEFHYRGVDSIDPLVVEYFYRLLDLLETQDVQLVFVWYPATAEYEHAAAEYFPVGNHLSEMYALLAGRGDVIVLDYHDLFYDQYELFTDNDHMNTAGAEILTQMLLADLKDEGVTWKVKP
jgi:hypothetical protein